MEIQGPVCEVKLRIVHILAPERAGLDSRRRGWFGARCSLRQTDIRLFIDDLDKIVADYFLTTEG